MFKKILILVFALAVFSCDKDDDDAPSTSLLTINFDGLEALGRCDF